MKRRYLIFLLITLVLGYQSFRDLPSLTNAQSSSTYLQILELGLSEPQNVAWSPSGDQIAIDGEDEVHIFTQNLVSVSQIDIDGLASDVVWSPSGAYLAILVNEYPINAIYIWDPGTQSLQSLTTLDQSQSTVASITWSSDENHIAGANENTVDIWDVSNGVQVAQLTSPNSRFFDTVSWSQSNGILIAGSELGTVDIWDVSNISSTNHLYTITARTNAAIGTNVLSPDGSMIATSDNTSIHIWNTSTGNLITTLNGHSSPIYSLYWSTTSLASASFGEVVNYWNVTSEQITASSAFTATAGMNTLISQIAWNPDATKLTSFDLEHNILQVWDIASNIAFANLDGFTQAISTIRWDSNGSKLISSGLQSDIYIWDALTGNVISNLGTASPFYALAWKPDDSQIAITNINVHIYDLSTDSELFEINGNSTVEWSPDGSMIATGDNNTIKIWDSSGVLMETLQGHSDRVLSVTWRSDGFYLASVSADATINIWDTTSWNIAATFNQQTPSPAIAWSPNGEFLASGGSQDENSVVYVWDIDTHGIYSVLQGHQDHITSISWKSDGELASGSRDTTIRIWDIASSQTVANLQHVSSVTSIAWSPNSEKLASASMNGRIIIWQEQSPLTCDHDIPASDTTTLISTITTANGSGNPTTICLAQDSTYTFTTANNYLNALPTITGDITIEGNNATITRSGTENFRFFEVDTGGKLTLNNLTLANGDVSGETERGGALMNDGGDLTLTNVTVNGNAGNTGGAIDNEAGTLTITDSTFTNNAAAYGGAIDNDSPATLTIAGSTFTSNTAVYDGGVIDNDGVLTISSSTFTSNTAAEYGGVIDNDGAVTINASTFTSNSSEGGGAIRNDSILTINAGSAFSTNAATNLGWGGAIYNKSGTTLVITATTFSGNSANLEGGAIRNQGSLTVNTGSSFDGNTAAQYGGAIYNTGGTVSLTGVQITNNSTTTYDAGAIYGNSSSSLTITDSTLDGNDSGRRGGGIWSSGSATLTNVTITNNTAVVEGGGVYGSSSATISAGNSCITGNTSRAVYSASATNQNFENNWWGATDGPSGSGSGSGDAVNAKIDYDPFITTACPLP